jgi:hypothetical protein
LHDTLVELLDAAEQGLETPTKKKTKETNNKKNGEERSGGGWIVLESPERVLWPPYVELLLRSGVAVEHPEDSSLLQLRHYTAQ